MMGVHTIWSKEQQQVLYDPESVKLRPMKIPGNYISLGLSCEPHSIHLISSNKGTNQTQWTREIIYIIKIILAPSTMLSSYN